MKKVAGTLKIDQAQFRELESFTKFGGDMDPVTARVIDKGRKNERLLIQPQYQPWDVADQVAVIYCGVHGLLEKVPMAKVAEFEKQYLQLLHAKHADDVLAVIASGKLTDDATAKLEAAAAEVSARFNN
jgi:F-type H+-transporting ATPase subunit alpha